MIISIAIYLLIIRNIYIVLEETMKNSSLLHETLTNYT